jgi:hypothetical protein
MAGASHAGGRATTPGTIALVAMISPLADDRLRLRKATSSPTFRS